MLEDTKVLRRSRGEVDGWGLWSQYELRGKLNEGDGSQIWAEIREFCSCLCVCRRVKVSEG